MNIKQKAACAGLLVGAACLLREWMYRRHTIDLNGRVVLITGGSRGLGFLLAREFAAQGARLCICARDTRELARAKDDLERAGAEVLTVQCDVTNQSQVELLVDTAIRYYGRIDILVNNAGTLRMGPLRAMKRADFEEACNVMFWGALNTSLAVLPAMLERKEGRIVNITSIGGKLPIPHLTPYSAGKFAAVGLSESMCIELARDGIKVVTVVPGLMRTGSFLNASIKGQQEREFALFALLAALPPFSMSAETAARRIVSAAQRGEPEMILSLPAKVLSRLHGLFPDTMLELGGLLNRLLPAAPAESVSHQPVGSRGMEVQERLHSPVLNAMMKLGLSSAERFHQYPGPLETIAHNGHAHNGHNGDHGGPRR